MEKTADIINLKRRPTYKKSFKVQDHIGIFDNYFTDKLCDKYISFFEKVQLRDRGNIKRVQDKHFSLLTELYATDLNINYIGKDFQRVFWTDCYPKYVEKYPIIKEFNKHRILDIKIQKTEKGEGFHVWHTEMMGPGDRNRFMVFSLYLNTVETGGETEFLHQSLRVEPIKNRFVMFPATYTHVHRGNPPLSGTKYIITGWVEFGE
tara:strand:- start:31 stop:648 length:618 start_codon:yes stop_codon:yes gene_type:complete